MLKRTSIDNNYSRNVHEILRLISERNNSLGNDVFFVLCIVRGTGHARANAMYRSLRLFGWLAWRRVTRAQRLAAEAFGDWQPAQPEGNA
jgi:hypothetical protein